MKLHLKAPGIRLVLEIGLVLLALALVLVPKVSQAANAASSASPSAALALYWYQCNGPNNHVGLFSNRVHIYCDSTTQVGSAPPLNTSIHWFAIPTSPDSASASRFMSLLQTSVIAGKPIWMQLDPSDTSGTSFGCGSGDCRRIYGMEMR